MSNSFVTLWTVARQIPLSKGFPRQEYWSGLPFPSPGIFLTQWWNPVFCVFCIGRWILCHWATWEALPWPQATQNFLVGRLGSAGCPPNHSSAHFISWGFWALYWLQRGEAQAVGFPDCPLSLHRSTKWSLATPRCSDWPLLHHYIPAFLGAFLQAYLDSWWKEGSVDSGGKL